MNSLNLAAGKRGGEWGEWSKLQGGKYTRLAEHMCRTNQLVPAFVACAALTPLRITSDYFGLPRTEIKENLAERRHKCEQPAQWPRKATGSAAHELYLFFTTFRSAADEDVRAPRKLYFFFTFSLPKSRLSDVRACSHVPVMHVLMLLPGGNGAESGECIFNSLSSRAHNGVGN